MRDGDELAGGRRGRLVDLLPALGLAMIGLVALVVASLSVSARDQLVVIAAPWTSRAEMLDLIWRAQGGVAGFGALPAVAVAMSDRDDFRDRLYQQGALLVFASPRFLGCFSQPPEMRDET